MLLEEDCFIFTSMEQILILSMCVTWHHLHPTTIKNIRYKKSQSTK